MNAKSDKIGILLSREVVDTIKYLLRKEYTECERNGEWYNQSAIIDAAKELNITL